ncbi:TPA: UDP-N-acetylmuramoyl-L-alanyl-D-glutamate--2,6-diaminopimelate ligase [Candidatus Bipolaricaulota bacterium]|nr:UDP-N-acetylmuramoyl-L-alanyl-D-glutamate--2,6-diaminopimelate ligase [Candidatus Bipolaricaulota bacterium]
MPKAGKLKALLREVEYLAISGDPEVEISAIVADSRAVRPGSLFVALVGAKHDGHDYIREAIENGAVAVVGEKDLPLELNGVTYLRVPDSRRALAELAAAFYGHPTRSLFTVGITGTKGKTTVAHLSWSLLGEEKTELISTITNNLERGIVNTTPEPITLQRIASEALRKGKESLVLEVSAHALSQHRVHRIDFDVAVFTNLSHDHLDYYKTMEDYLWAKLKLFSILKPSGVAIINRDDPYGRKFIAATATKAGAEVLTYGFSPKAVIQADGLRLRLTGSRFLVRTPVGEMAIETALPGEFNVYNILAAAGVGLARGLPLREIKERLERVKHIEGRCERYPARAGFDVVIDFAHSPDALKKMIEALKPHYHRVLTVFGCGGESDRTKRPLMGRIAGELSDYVIITSDNPKSEEPGRIIAEIVAGLEETSVRYEAIVDRRGAIRRALELAHPGDVILIAGKGHERSQVFADREEKFNDREFLKGEGVL